MTPTRVALALKAGIALAGLLLLAWEAWNRRYHPSDRRRSQRFTRVLPLLGVAACLGWFNFGGFHFWNFLHPPEFFHYYLGAKYQQELGYTRLYQCVAMADIEAGRASDVYDHWARNLSTNQIEPGGNLLAGNDCRTRFSPARWATFRHEVDLLRRRLSSATRWAEIRLDHGYNATPVWTAAGSALANLAPASERFFLVLALIDPVLLTVLWALVWWAFGWEALCVALLWWGTNYPARFLWTGGGFARTDWLVLTVASVALVKRDHPMLGGFALGWATLLRVFPAFMVVPLAIAESSRMLRERTWRPSHESVSIAAGMLVAAALLVPASSLATAGRAFDADSWRGFVDNSRKHYQSPSTNAVGLRPLVAFDPATRVSQTRDLWLDGPWDAWRQARLRTFERRAPLFWGLATLLVLALGLGARHRPAWEALALGVLVLPLALQLSSYYYAVLLLPGVLWLRHRGIGVALMATSLVTALSPAVFSEDDEIFAVVNVAVVGLAAGVAVWTGWTSRHLPAPGSRADETAAIL